MSPDIYYMMNLKYYFGTTNVGTLFLSYYLGPGLVPSYFGLYFDYDFN